MFYYYMFMLIESFQFLRKIPPLHRFSQIYSDLLMDDIIDKRRSIDNNSGEPGNGPSLSGIFDWKPLLFLLNADRLCNVTV